MTARWPLEEESGMRGRKWAALLSVLVSGLALSACSQAPTVAKFCTDVGCESGLYLSFDRAPEAGTTISVSTGAGFPWTIECTAATPCGQRVFLQDFMPDEAVVTITTSTGQSTQEIQPLYEKSQPNGPDCSPTCYQGTVKLQLP